jgi:hypothetical protein
MPRVRVVVADMKPSRRKKSVEKTPSTPSAAHEAEVGRPPRTNEPSEKFAHLPKRFRPRILPRGSQRDPDIRATVADYTKTLIKLYEITDPIRGVVSEEDKLERARQAIELWWYLYGDLLLWAQSQITGYEFGRSNPEIMEKLSVFDREITVDSHILEYIGVGFSLNPVNYDDPVLEKIDELIEKYGGGLDDPARRSLIRELLMSRSAISSFWRFELQFALHALNLGHVEDIVRPVAVRRQGNPVLLLSWKVKALQHVYFHVGKGMKKYRALQLVSDALGQSTETLRSWEKFISNDDDMAMELSAAEIAGQFEGDFDKLSIKEMINLYGAEYYRKVTNVEYAKLALETIRSTPLDEVREGLRSGRRAKKSGS